MLFSKFLNYLLKNPFSHSAVTLSNDFFHSAHRSTMTNSTTVTTRSLLVGALIGFAFGFALEKAKVFLPHTIQAQMLFQQLTMIKMFLSAAASSMIFLSIIESLQHFSRSSRMHTLGFGMPPYSANALGGFLLGVGM
jgi:hypothetical protein